MNWTTSCEFPVPSRPHNLQIPGMGSRSQQPYSLRIPPIAQQSRDDELQQIELEKARLDLERQRKAIVFEEQRRANELAFDEERRAQERELHQRKLAQLLPLEYQQLNQLSNQEGVDEGEIPLEAKEVSLLFPAAPQKEIAAIFEGKFDPANLCKLHRKVTLSNDEDEEISFAGGKLRAKIRSGTAKDYPQPGVWSTAFFNTSRSSHSHGSNFTYA